MLEFLKRFHRYHLTILLIVMSLFSFTLSVFRVIFTKTDWFLFLNWNLFLAFIPWAFSTVIITKPNLHHQKWLAAGLLASWLLFFPNSPYILTDLFHLKEDPSMPIWFDLVLILSFAWTGLLYGFVSLFNIELYLSRFLSNKIIPFISIFLLFLGSYGIYLGRYLRWNSWDIIKEPYALLYSMGSTIKNPFTHTRAWGMTILMGVLLNMIYWSLKAIELGNNEKPNNQNNGYGSGN